LFAGTVSGDCRVRQGGVARKGGVRGEGIILGLNISDNSTIYAATSFDGVLASRRDGRSTRQMTISEKSKHANTNRFVEIAGAELRAINAERLRHDPIPLDSNHIMPRHQ